MLMENILKIHEDSLYGSLDYKVSEFILLNTFEMSGYSLGDIAKEVNLPKSSVASFFSNSRMSGGFPLFQRTLTTELGRKTVTINVYLRQIRAFLNRVPKRLRVDHNDSFERVAEEIFASRKVIFLGPKTFRESFSPLESLLWKKKIPSRYIVMSCIRRYEEELSELTDEDLVIIIYPHENYREFRYFLNSFPTVASTIEKCTGRLLYLLSDSAGADESKCATIIPAGANPAEIPAAANFAAFKLFYTCAERSGLDLSQQICII